MAHVNGCVPDALPDKMSGPSRRLELSVVPEQFIIARLASNAPLPPWATQGRFFSITRTPDELSIVCAVERVPKSFGDDIRWRAFKVRGPMALSEVGVLASLATPLADARMCIFVVSTFETDYVLVNSEQLPDAITALQKAGHRIEDVKIASSGISGEGRND
jgi:uncharacterized protein